jgi:predicted amidohydrolase YtcJ
MLAAVLAVVITHAHVLTMSPALPVASTLALVDGRVAYAGDDEAAGRRAAGPGAEVIDAAGHTIVPGFNDAHVHFGYSLTLGGTRGVEIPELPKKAWLAAIADAARGRPANDWLFVTTPSLPDGVGRAGDLDVVPRPLFVVTKRGGLVNHRAMALCRFARDEAPRGFVRGRELNAALDRAIKSLPERTLLDGARDFLGELGRLGITSVQLIDELPDVFEKLRREGALTARVRFVPIGYRFANPLYHSEWHAAAPEWVRVDGVKYFHDDWARITRYELQALYDDSTKADRRVVLHVLSRRALASFLDAVERMGKSAPEKVRLFRVDHADEVTRAEADRLAKLGIIVCSNPSMLPEWRNEHAFPMHTLIAAGVRTCIGTDWYGHHTPARSLAPLESVEQAVTHGGFGTSERIEPAQALEAYTVGSAAAEGMADKKGTLAPGMLADLVILSDDPLATPPEQLGEIEVLMTVAGGRVVYRRGGFAGPPPPTIHAPPPPPQPSIGAPKPPPPPTIGPAPPPPALKHKSR